MYAEYRRKSSTNRTHTVPNYKDLYKDLSATEQEAVIKAWTEVERQRQEGSANDQNSEVQRHQGDSWRTIRVFVSSTFTDFHNEREVLVKKVRNKFCALFTGSVLKLIIKVYWYSL